MYISLGLPEEEVTVFLQPRVLIILLMLLVGIALAFLYVSLKAHYACEDRTCRIGGWFQNTTLVRMAKTIYNLLTDSCVY